MKIIRSDERGAGSTRGRRSMGGNSMRVRAGSSLLVGLLLSTAAATCAVAAQGKCDVASIKALTPADAVIDKVTPIAAPVAHCEVLGHIITQNPGPNRVEWSLMLPDEGFKGRYYFQGLGAAAGLVPTAVPSADANYYNGTFLNLLKQGFAIAGSDTGHKGGMWDFGVDDPVKRLDHGHRGAHVSAVATQAMTRAYYGMNNKLYRYHLGCSGGGRMGAIAAYHHPEDFDGIVASTGFGGGSVWFPWIVQYVVENPERWVSPQKLAMLERKVTEHCAGPDGLIRDPNACGFDPASLQCKGADSDSCLTAPQVDMIKRITGRHPIAPGKTSPGFSLTNPTGWASFLLGNTKPTSKDPKNPWAPNPPPAAFGIGQSILRGFYFHDANFSIINDLDFNNPEHLKILGDHHADWGLDSYDLSAFKKAGGKLMMWAPLGENAVPPGTEIEYFEQLKKVVPRTDDFVRLYFAPGLWHCRGGIGPQDVPDRLLDKVIAWVEQGKKPAEIVAAAPALDAMLTAHGVGQPRDGSPPVPPAMISATRTVLLCPYPKTAVFNAPKGTFPYDADNWTCK
jgi:hypothetical protein